MPVAALLSATFPKDVDLSSLGRSSNPHGAASLLGFFSVVAAGAPTLVILAVAALSGRSWMLPALLLAWGGAALALNRLLSAAAGRLLRQRRENIAGVV
jgi:hypothetical protein